MSRRKASVILLADEVDGGGAERVTVDAARALLAVGHEALIVTHPRTPVSEAAIEGLAAEGVPVRVLPAGRSVGLGTLTAIRRVLREVRPDVLYAYAPQVLVSLRVIGALPRGMHVVFGMHGHTLFPLYRNCLRALGRRLNGVVCVSQAVRREVCQRAPELADRTTTIYHCYRAPEIMPPRGALAGELGLAGGRAIGTVARLVPCKRQDLIVSALPEICRHVPDTHVVIAGDGPCREALRAQVAEMGLEDRVHLLGWRRDVYAVHRSLDVFLHPSSHEALGLAVVEAGAAGVPAIVTDVHGQAETVVDGTTGLVLPAGDLDALADGTVALLTDTDRAREMGRAARDHVARVFSPQALQTRYALLIDDLLEKRPLRDLAAA